MKQDKWRTLILPDYAHYPWIFNTIFGAFIRFGVAIWGLKESEKIKQQI